MATCKDCIHYDVCQYHITDETPMTVAECEHFKNKAEQYKNSELETCPFCGGKAYIKSWLPYDGYQGESTKYRVTCKDCNARTDDVDTKQRAIELWNKRKTERGVSN